MALVLTGVLALSGCNTEFAATYKPGLLPIVVSLSSAGELTLSMAEELRTPIGTFGVEGGVSAPFRDQTQTSDTYALTIRHLQQGQLVDTAYVLPQDIDFDVASERGPIHVSKSGHNYAFDVSRADLEQFTITSDNEIVPVPRNSDLSTMDATHDQSNQNDDGVAPTVSADTDPLCGCSTDDSTNDDSTTYADDSETYDSETYDSETYDSETYDSETYDSETYDSETYDSETYDSETYDSETYADDSSESDGSNTSDEGSS